MQAMLIEEDPAARAGTAAALAQAGFAVTVAGSVEDAKAAVRRASVDVLVTPERVGGRLAHDVALLAEWRNPGLGTILLSDRKEDMDEIFELLPSLRAVLERDAPARTLAQLALAAARWQEAPAATPEVGVEAADADVAQAVAEAAPARATGRPERAGSGHPLAGLVAGAPAPADLATPARVPEVLDLRPAVAITPQPAAASLLARVPSFLRFARPRPEPAVERPAPAPIPAAPARRLHLA